MSRARPVDHADHVPANRPLQAPCQPSFMQAACRAHPLAFPLQELCQAGGPVSVPKPKYFWLDALSHSGV